MGFFYVRFANDFEKMIFYIIFFSKKEVGAGICYGDQGIIWWMNVLSLIELKVLKNDDMNGPSVSHKKMIYL